MLKQKYFLTGIFILSAERQPIKLAWRKIVWLQELWLNLKRAGVYLPLVLLLWLFVYLINTVSWHIIIRSGGKTGGHLSGSTNSQ